MKYPRVDYMSISKRVISISIFLRLIIILLQVLIIKSTKIFRIFLVIFHCQVT